MESMQDQYLQTAQQVDKHGHCTASLVILPLMAVRKKITVEDVGTVHVILPTKNHCISSCNIYRTLKKYTATYTYHFRTITLHFIQRAEQEDFKSCYCYKEKRHNV